MLLTTWCKEKIITTKSFFINSSCIDDRQKKWLVGEDGCVGGVEKKTKINSVLQLTDEDWARMEKGWISTVFTIHYHPGRNPFTPLQLDCSGWATVIDPFASFPQEILWEKISDPLSLLAHPLTALNWTSTLLLRDWMISSVQDPQSWGVPTTKMEAEETPQRLS